MLKFKIKTRAIWAFPSLSPLFQLKNIWTLWMRFVQILSRTVNMLLGPMTDQSKCGTRLENAWKQWLVMQKASGVYIISLMARDLFQVHQTAQHRFGMLKPEKALRPWRNILEGSIVQWQAMIWVKLPLVEVITCSASGTLVNLPSPCSKTRRVSPA